MLAPFMTLAANRIVAGDAVPIWAVVPVSQMIPGLAAIVAGLALGLPARHVGLRLAGPLVGLAGLLWLLVQGAPALLEGAGDYARVSPAAGFWCLLVIFALLMADAITAMKPGPFQRALLLTAVLGPVRRARLWCAGTAVGDAGICRAP